MSSFFSRKKEKRNLQLVPPSSSSSVPSSSPASPPSSASPLQSSHSPVSPHVSSQPITSPGSPLSPFPSSPLSCPPLTVKKTKKANFLSSLFHSKQARAAGAGGAGAAAASSSAADGKDVKGSKGMLGIFSRRKKRTQLVRNNRGEEEEREISVSVTVSRLHRGGAAAGGGAAGGDDGDELLPGAFDADDVLIFPIFGIPLCKIAEVKQGAIAAASSAASDAAAAAPCLPLPKQMLELCEYLRYHALRTEGLFRISGESAGIKDLQDSIDRGDELELHSAAVSINVHNLAGLFKRYFRLLPDPLFPYAHYDALLQAVDSQSMDSLPAIVGLFPAVNRAVLHYLLTFLSQVAEAGEVNRMTALNLAVCWSPNVLRVREERLEQVRVDAAKVVSVLQWLIEQKGRERTEEREREEREEAERRSREEQQRRVRETEEAARRQQEEQEAIEREIEQQLEAENRRKARQREQDEQRRKEKQQRDEEERKQREAKRKSLKRAEQPLDHLPSCPRQKRH